MQKIQIYRLWRVLTGGSARRKACRLALLNKRFATTQCVWQCRQKWDICDFCVPNRAKIAMAVYAGIVREVYEIESWHRAGTTHYATRNQSELAKQKSKRWEFIGSVAPEPERSLYVGRSVAHLFRSGQQSPVVGIGLDVQPGSPHGRCAIKLRSAPELGR